MNSPRVHFSLCAAAFAAALLITALSAAENPPSAPSAPDLGSLLRDALFEEEATRDLSKAALGYEALLTKWAAQRQIAAAALFRLAEVRRKQDRRDDAIKLYQQFLTGFSDVEPHAKLARENLSALGVKDPATPAAGSVPADPDEEKELRRLTMLAENSPDKVLEPVPWPESGHKDGKIGALSNAAMRGWAKVAAFLLDHGADPNVNRSLGGSPLYAAAANGHKAICELLLAKGAKIETGSAALGNAIAENYNAVAELLIAKGVDINDDCTVNLDEANKRGWLSLTPLAIAISRDNNVWIDRLLALKADVNAVSSGQHMTALQVAAWRGNRVVLEKLLGLGARPDEHDELHDHTAAELRDPGTDAAGWRALHYAAGDPGMTEALLKAGANPSIADSHGLTPLHVACMRGQLDCVRLLLAAKSDVNARGTVRRTPNLAPDHSDITPLHAAALTANAALIEALLAAGANPNPPVPDGQNTRTPLALAMNAVFNDNTKGSAAVAALLKANADANATLDLSPVVLATGIKDTALRDTILRLLLEHGADLDLAIRHSPASVRVVLLRSHKYPRLAEKPEISFVYADEGIEHQLDTRHAAEGKPGLLPTLLLSWHDRGGWTQQSNTVPDYSTLRHYRKGGDGKLAETILTMKPGMEFPTLEWGDIIQVVSARATEAAPPANTAQPHIPRPGGPVGVPYIPGQTPSAQGNTVINVLPPDIVAILRGSQSVRITFKSGDFSKDLTLRGVLRTYDLIGSEAPLQSLDRTVNLLAGPGPGMVKIERSAARGGGTVEWAAGSGNGNPLPEDGDVITFTPDKPNSKNLRVSLRVTGQPGAWQSYGPTQSVSLLQFLSEFYRGLSPQLLVPGSGPDTDGAVLAKKIKALTPDELLANLIASGENPSGWPYLPWPDWSGVKVRRWIKSGEQEEDGKIIFRPAYKLGDPEPFDLLDAMKSLTPESIPDDARKFDTILNPGDEVELPLLKDHPAGSWPGFDEAAVRLFTRALIAKVTVSDPDGRFHQATLQWLPPRWVPTPAGVLPIPDGAASGGRVHWIRALQFVKSVVPGMEVDSVSRQNAFVVDPKQGEKSDDVFLRPGDRIMLRPAPRTPAPVPIPRPGIPNVPRTRVIQSPTSPQ